MGHGTTILFVFLFFFFFIPLPQLAFEALLIASEALFAGFEALLLIW